MSNSNYLDATAVAEFMGTSVPTAYKIIRKLNDELNANGYITIAGKVNKKFFETKIYGPCERSLAFGGQVNVSL